LITSMSDNEVSTIAQRIDQIMNPSTLSESRVLNDIWEQLNEDNQELIVNLMAQLAYKCYMADSAPITDKTDNQSVVPDLKD
jgi:hypothetical protein